MVEKICSHCKTTLLVGLQYCPGCLHPIEGHQADPYSGDSSGDYVDGGRINPDTLFNDLKVVWSNVTYPLRAATCRLFRRPEPPDPAPSPIAYRRDESRFTLSSNIAPTRLSFSQNYTRIVCPRCQHSQNASSSVTPSDLIFCEKCEHRFPGSFAAEFRRGADLHCFRCGVTTFCVGGQKVTMCPNCRASSVTVRAKTRLRPTVVATFLVSLFLVGLFVAVLTRSTTQYLVLLTVTCIGSFLGFCTLAALGF